MDSIAIACVLALSIYCIAFDVALIRRRAYNLVQLALTVTVILCTIAVIFILSRL